jgi:hypothetical protein
MPLDWREFLLTIGSLEAQPSFIRPAPDEFNLSDVHAIWDRQLIAPLPPRSLDNL